MSRFTLTILDDGRAILTTEEALSVDQWHQIREAWKAWRDTPEAVAIIAECKVEHAHSVEIDLPVTAA